MDLWPVIRDGGVIGLFFVVGLLALRGLINLNPSAVEKFWRERLADKDAAFQRETAILTADRDDWRDQAKAAVDANERLAAALEARNRRDFERGRKSDRP